MDSTTMIHLARSIIDGYDIHRRTGIRTSMAIPTRQVAEQMVRDIVREDRFLEFVARIVKAQDVGIMGRRYAIPHLREIIKSTYELGFVYDTANEMFVEDGRVRRTRNWSVLVSGTEYTIVFLRIDIVGNSELVRHYPKQIVSATYDDLRTIVNDACEARNGRIWSWEGDGGIVAFYFGKRHASAVLSAMEITHDLYLYNRTRCHLDEPVKVRIAVHAGPCEYTESEEALKKFETIKELVGIEEKAPADSVYVSIVVRVMLDEIVASVLKRVNNKKTLLPAMLWRSNLDYPGPSRESGQGRRKTIRCNPPFEDLRFRNNNRITRT